MDYNLAKGIAPGKIISHEINKRKLSQREFAKMIDIHSQSLNAVIKGHRKLTIEMSLKIEKGLDMPEGALLMLQVYHSIKEFKNENNHTEDLKKTPNVRRILFWDTDFSKIDWKRQKKAVIRRVRERGTEEEKMEISKFYNLPLSEFT